MGRGRDWLGEREGLVSGEDSYGGGGWEGRSVRVDCSLAVALTLPYTRVKDFVPRLYLQYN